MAKLPSLSIIETVDSVAKAQKLNDHRGDMEPLGIYLQINTSGESQKSGLMYDPSTPEGKISEEILSISRYIVENCPKLLLLGIMTIGSFDNSTKEGVNTDFEVSLLLCLVYLEFIF